MSSEWSALQDTLLAASHQRLMREHEAKETPTMYVVNDKLEGTESVHIVRVSVSKDKLISNLIEYIKDGSVYLGHPSTDDTRVIALACSWMPF